MDREAERRAIHEGYAAIERLTGQKPPGWYCRYGPSENTRDLVVEHGGFMYDSNSYADDLPYYTTVQTTTGERPWLVVPYSLTVNDSKFWRGGLSTGEDFFQAMKETFDTLYEEGAETPRMMNVGLHCRIAGSRAERTGWTGSSPTPELPGHVWFAGRSDIARAWLRAISAGAVIPSMRTYSTPMIAVMFVAMIIIAWLAGVEWWMIAIGAVVALIGYFLERRRGFDTCRDSSQKVNLSAAKRLTVPNCTRVGEILRCAQDDTEAVTLLPGRVPRRAGAAARSGRSGASRGRSGSGRPRSGPSRPGHAAPPAAGSGAGPCTVAGRPLAPGSRGSRRPRGGPPVPASRSANDPHLRRGSSTGGELGVHERGRRGRPVAHGPAGPAARQGRAADSADGCSSGRRAGGTFRKRSR